MHVNWFSCVWFFETLWTIITTKLLSPLDSPGKNTGMGCHTFFQGMFLTQRSNPRLFHLLHWEVGSLSLALLAVNSSHAKLVYFIYSDFLIYVLIIIDYAKAFDCVGHNKLWKILKEMGIPDHLLRNPYADQEATVKAGHGTMEWFQIGKRIRQRSMSRLYIVTLLI